MLNADLRAPRTGADLVTGTGRIHHRHHAGFVTSFEGSINGEAASIGLPDGDDALLLLHPDGS